MSRGSVFISSYAYHLAPEQNLFFGRTGYPAPNNRQSLFTPNLREGDIKAAFVEAFNKLLGDKKRYIARFEKLLPILANTEGLERELVTLSAVYSDQMDSLRRYMEENTRQVQDQEEYSRRFSEMSAACSATETKINKVKEEILAQHGRKEQIRRCLNELKRCGDILETFDMDLWNAVVENVRVNADKVLVFRFRDGTKITGKFAGEKIVKLFL